MPRIPLIEDLTTAPIPPGSNLLVEYDPASQWYNASITMAAGWLQTGGKIHYFTTSQPTDNIRSQLHRLAVEAERCESDDRLRIWDAYTSQLGRKSKERYALDSVKVADLSIWAAKEFMTGATASEWLRLIDNVSVLSRFNEDKAWVDFQLARVIPSASLQKSTAIRGIVRGYHSDWVYKALEAGVDGMIDFKLDETGEEPKNLIRIRSMRNATFDGKWHTLRIGENFAVTLEK